MSAYFNGDRYDIESKLAREEAGQARWNRRLADSILIDCAALSWAAQHAMLVNQGGMTIHEATEILKERTNAAE